MTFAAAFVGGLLCGLLGYRLGRTHGYRRGFSDRALLVATTMAYRPRIEAGGSTRETQ